AYAVPSEAPITRGSCELHHRDARCVRRAACWLRSDMRRPDPSPAAGGRAWQSAVTGREDPEGDRPPPPRLSRVTVVSWCPCDWRDAGRTGFRDMRVEIAMMRTPDGHSRLEMSRFLAPPVVADHRSAPVNALGYLRVMFTVEDIDDTLARLDKRGAELVGKVVQYEDTYRL